MAAFGGLTVLEIARDGAVEARSAALPGGAIDTLVAHTHMYYTCVQRDAAEVLKDQDAALSRGRRATGRPEPDAAVADSLHRIKELGHRILAAIQGQDFDGWGHLLHEHWEQKKRLSSRISLSAVDELYEHVRSEYGVLGGKIAGAGGGGFLMLYAPSGHERLEAFMASRGMPRLRYAVAPTGVEVVADLRAGAQRTEPGPGSARGSPDGEGAEGAEGAEDVLARRR
jgi:D-glycero-alpha-D-manno-heptose-7-phosphate kinase